MAHVGAFGPEHLNAKSHEESDEGQLASQIRILTLRLRVRVSRGFAVTGYRLRERLAAPVAETCDVQTLSSGGHR